jgi:hypothetical protein
LALGQNAKSARSSGAASVTLDCVVASIGDEAITQSDVMGEYRLERFLNGQPAEGPLDHETHIKIRDRLIERKLLADEAAALDLSDKEADAAARQQWDDAERRYSTPQAFQAALRSLGMDKTQVIPKLVEEQKVLALIERRLRPQAAVDPSEIEAYYRDHFTPQFKQRSSGNLPPLTQVEGQIREILIQQKIDALLAQWVEELKTARRVVLHSFCDHEPN